jgi:hypothetical protein
MQVTKSSYFIFSLPHNLRPVISDVLLLMDGIKIKSVQFILASTKSLHSKALVLTGCCQFFLFVFFFFFGGTED